MKFFIAFALIATVASAAIKPTQLNSDLAEIVAAIQSPSTDPATAAALEAMLQDIMGIAVGPAIVETNPIAVGPAIIDFPLPDGGAVTADEPAPVVNPSPVVDPVAPVASENTPLVQIIVNVNKPESVVAPSPVDTPVVEEVYVPGPVNVVDNVVPEPVVEPIIVVEPVVPEPIQVVEPVIPEPIQVVEPLPVVALPEELN